MSFGDDKWQEWVLNEEESLPLLEHAFKVGLNTWDTVRRPPPNLMLYHVFRPRTSTCSARTRPLCASTARFRRTTKRPTTLLHNTSLPSTSATHV